MARRTARGPALVLLALVALVTVVGLPAAGPRLAGAAPEAPATPPAFPAAWRGHWKGEARLVRPTGAATRFEMELLVEPTETAGRWTWTVIYAGDQGRQERRYHLVAKDVGKGSFAIDEGNGIELQSQFLDGGLYGQFVVGGTRITSRDRLEGAGTPDERLVTELITTRDADPVASGGKDGVPEVLAYPVRTLQTATLRRVLSPPK